MFDGSLLATWDTKCLPTRVTGFGWFIVILAFLADLSTHAAASQARRREASAR